MEKNNTHWISFRLHECEFPGPEKGPNGNKLEGKTGGASFVVGGVT